MPTRRGFMGGLGAGVVAASLAKVGVAADDGPSPLTIEGYAGRLTYRAGEEVELHVSTTAPRYDLEISRLGAKTDVVHTKTGIAGASHSIPENASSHGCNWP